MNTFSMVALVLAAAPLLAHAADEPPKAGTRTYAFRAFLDDKPIGQHRFTVVTDGAGGRKVASEADFQVKILGFTAYRYHHHADEQWVGDCLAGLQATTDDDGKPAKVSLDRSGDANTIRTGAGTKSESGCLMTYAYWNPAMREQRRLLNPQTGKVDAVKVERVGPGNVVVGGQEVAATDWRISGGESPIDLWISESGDWVGLDSMVSKGKHRLTYRLP